MSMRYVLNRIIVLLLAPCLVAEPSAGQYVSVQPSAHVVCSSSGLFTSSALSLPEPVSQHPGGNILASKLMARLGTFFYETMSRLHAFVPRSRPAPERAIEEEVHAPIELGPSVPQAFETLRAEAAAGELSDSQWREHFRTIERALIQYRNSNDRTDPDLFDAYKQSGGLAIAAAMIERFPQQEPAIRGSLLHLRLDDALDLRYGHELEGKWPDNYRIWNLQPELMPGPEPEPQWRTAVPDRFAQPPEGWVGRWEWRAGCDTVVRDYNTSYILTAATAGSQEPHVALVSSRVTEHRINVHTNERNEFLLPINPITDDIRCRSLRPLSSDADMLSYIAWLREFRRRRAIVLRMRKQPGSNFWVDDAVVRITDPVREQAKEWLYRQPPPADRPGKYWEVTGNSLEVVRFLVGWGYIEREEQPVQPSSREQIEHYMVLVDGQGDYYIGKGFRSRWGNVNIYAKERLGFLLGEPGNYMPVFSPSREEAPDLYNTRLFGWTFAWRPEDQKPVDAVPYMSALTLNVERRYRRDPSSVPNLITDSKVLRSWQLVIDAWTRNVDAKYTNLFPIEIEAPGQGRIEVMMKIDPDFQVHPHHREITNPEGGRAFERQYLAQKQRYWGLDPRGFTIEDYDLQAFRDAIDYAQTMDIPGLFQRELELLTWKFVTGSYVVGEILDGPGLQAEAIALQQTIEPVAFRLLSLMTGQRTIKLPPSRFCRPESRDA